MSALTYQDGLKEGMEGAATEFASEMRSAIKDFEKGILLESDLRKRVEYTYNRIIKSLAHMK